jgi:hypothetical protein
MRPQFAPRTGAVSLMRRVSCIPSGQTQSGHDINGLWTSNIGRCDPAVDPTAEYCNRTPWSKCMEKPPPVGAVTAFDFTHDSDRNVSELLARMQLQRFSHIQP